jgi:hypothetical protein
MKSVIELCFGIANALHLNALLYSMFCVFREEIDDPTRVSDSSLYLCLARKLTTQQERD